MTKEEKELMHDQEVLVEHALTALQVAAKLEEKIDGFQERLTDVITVLVLNNELITFLTSCNKDLEGRFDTVNKQLEQMIKNYKNLKQECFLEASNFENLHNAFEEAVYKMRTKGNANTI